MRSFPNWSQAFALVPKKIISSSCKKVVRNWQRACSRTRKDKVATAKWPAPEGYSAEADLTYTTWPRWIMGEALILLSYQFAVLPTSALNFSLWPSQGSLTIPFAVFEFSNVNTFIETFFSRFTDIDSASSIGIATIPLHGLLIESSTQSS